jgi:cyclase
MASTGALPTSKHFRLEQLTDGVYAAIAIPGTGSASNAGIIDLGNRTLVFDTFQTPQAAADLRAAAEHLLNRPIAYVIDSHWHADHIQGNQAFALETPIIATSRTRELIATSGAETMAEIKTQAPASLQELEGQLAQAHDEQQRAALALQIGEARELAACAPTLALRLPEQTIDQRIVFHGSRRAVELLTYGGGHTESDAFLVLPGEKLAFMGDLLFVQSHLWMGHGNPQEWLRILGQVAEIDLKTVVPGHGPIGTPEDFTAAAHYIKAIQQIAGDALKSGKSAEQAQATPIPAPFEAWAWREGYAANIQALYEQLAKTGA